MTDPPPVPPSSWVMVPVYLETFFCLDRNSPCGFLFKFLLRDGPTRVLCHNGLNAYLALFFSSSCPSWILLTARFSCCPHGAVCSSSEGIFNPQTEHLHYSSVPLVPVAYWFLFSACYRNTTRSPKFFFFLSRAGRSGSVLIPLVHVCHGNSGAACTFSPTFKNLVDSLYHVGFCLPRVYDASPPTSSVFSDFSAVFCPLSAKLPLFPEHPPRPFQNDPPPFFNFFFLAHCSRFGGLQIRQFCKF